MSAAVELAGAVAVAAVVSGVACGLAVRARVLDNPRGLVRKGDRPPVPTSGGLGVALGVCAGLAVLASTGALHWAESLPLQAPRWLAAALAVAVCALFIGLLDDIATFGPRLKGALFLALAFAAPLLIGPVEALPLGWGLALPVGYVVGVLGSALWMFTIMNTVNFIDGLNGLAMGSAAIGLFGLSAAAFAVSAPASATVALMGAAALLGFLVWNFPAGRLFAGDAGALFVGALVGAIGLMAVQEGGLSPFIPAILFFPMLADVLLTLAWRVSRRRKILEGHRDHFYQIALRAGASPVQVTLIYWALMLKCGVIGVALALLPPVTPAAVAAAAPQAPAWAQALVLGAAGLASSAILAAFLVLTAVWLKASFAVRAFAKARGHDTE